MMVYATLRSVSPRAWKLNRQLPFSPQGIG
jgi:hypothetical protein